MNGPGNKINLNQAVVEANTTKQVASNKQMNSHLRVGLSCLRGCSRNGGILCRSSFCRRHRRHSHRRSCTRGTACCFGSATPTCRRMFLFRVLRAENHRYKIGQPKTAFYGSWATNGTPDFVPTRAKLKLG